MTNAGDVPAYRVRAETESEVGVLDTTEFLFGRIDPGQTVNRTRSITVPAALYSLAEPVSVKVFQNVDAPATETRASVHIAARPTPQFAYTLTVVDDGSGLSRGNGDGRIQPGEDIDVLLVARNIGAVPVTKAFAKLSNTSGKYVDVRRGTLSFPKVEPGAWVSGRFSLSVKSSYRRSTVRAELVFGDSLFAMTPSERVVLPVDAELPPLVEETPGRVAARGDGLLEIHSCAGEPCAPFMVASPDAVLDVTGKLPGWLRVQVPVGDESALGWVPLEAVRWLPDFRHVSTGEEFQPLFRTVPPRVVVHYPDLEVGHAVDTIVFSGEVVDDASIHAFYLFVNGRKKVFQVVDEREWARDPDGRVRWHFSQEVPLEEGSNLIEVWAQDAEQHQGMDLFQVYRDATSQPGSAVVASSAPAG